MQNSLYESDHLRKQTVTGILVLLCTSTEHVVVRTSNTERFQSDVI